LYQDGDDCCGDDCCGDDGCVDIMMVGVIVNKTVQYVNNRRKLVEDERFQEV
jgi:hypothetical protein